MCLIFTSLNAIISRVGDRNFVVLNSEVLNFLRFLANLYKDFISRR